MQWVNALNHARALNDTHTCVRRGTYAAARFLQNIGAQTHTAQHAAIHTWHEQPDVATRFLQRIKQ